MKKLSRCPSPFTQIRVITNTPARADVNPTIAAILDNAPPAAAEGGTAESEALGETTGFGVRPENKQKTITKKKQKNNK